jgi:hypothetical protein
MSNYNFMQSGIGVAEDPDLSQREFIAYGSTLAALIATATEQAGIYVSHCGRNIQTIEDQRRSLMWVLTGFFNLPNFDQIVSHYREILLSNDTDMGDISGQNQVEMPFTLSLCDCNVCSSMNAIDANFSQWEPQTALEEAIRDTIGTSFINFV